MAKIKIMPFGGQDERGKNCVLINIDGDFYVFDMGLKLPESSILGIDIIIPDYEYLYNNIQKIKGVFLSNASSYNSGGLQYFIRKQKVPIYCNEISAIVFRYKNSKIRLNHRNTSIIEIKDKDILDFGKVKIEVFKTTASSPNSLNFAIHTEDGTIVYLSEFIYEGEMKKYFETDFDHIAKIAKNDVIALLIDSEYASRPGYTAPNHKLEKYLPSIIKEKKKRVVFAIFEEDIFNMYQIIKEALDADRKVCLYGNLLNELFKNVNLVEELGFSRDSFITNEQFENSQDAVLVIAGNGKALYTKLAKIALGNDEFIQLDENDILVIATPPAPGVERRHADVLDELSRTNGRVISLSERNLWSMRASYEDVKLAINMIKPKKIIPVKGLYKDFLGTRRAAVECRLDEKDVFILENGDSLEILGGKEYKQSKEIKVIDDVFVDGIGVGDVSDAILYERKALGSDGVIVAGVNVSAKTKETASLIDVQMRGVSNTSEDEGQLLVKIQKTISDELENYAKQYKENPQDYNVNLVKKELMTKLKFMVKKEIGKQPIVLLVVNEVRDN